MIKIVSDSTCDLTNEVCEKYNISIIPLHIVLGDEEYRDRIEITPAEIFKWSDEHKSTPKTSAVSFEDAKEVIKPIIDAGDEVICFTISESMSTTGNVIRLVGADLNASDRVHVFNTKSLSNGVGMLAVEASIMAQKGMAVTDILSELEILRDKLNVSFVIDTLVYLSRGGRCKPVVALAGSVLKLHPKIILAGGAMDVDKKYRGHMSAVALNYVKDMESKLLTAKSDRVYLVSAGMDEKIVASVKEYLMSLGRFEEIIESVAGGVISSHCGPGTLGVMFIEN